jgi:thiol-disulfide isomerase/thioredoxin
MEGLTIVTEQPLEFVDLDEKNFRSVVGAGGIVLVLCWAPSCGVCHAFEPVYRRVGETHPGHTFARMNVQAEEELGKFFEIEHTPTLMLYRDGLLLLKKPGTFEASELNSIVSQAESLDMDLVRADLENNDENT